MMHTGAKRSLLVAIFIAIVVSLFSAQFNRYYRDVAIDVAISIILGSYCVDAVFRCECSHTILLYQVLVQLSGRQSPQETPLYRLL